MLNRVSRALPLAAIVAALGLWSVPLTAHHGWGGYGDDEFELTGVVESPVSTSGPHATMKVRAEGQVWDVVMAPPFRTEQAGLEEGMIPIGATVMLHGHRHRDPKRFEIKTERLTWDGKLFNLYPDRK